MSKVGVHCYGCDAVATVDEEHPSEGLRVARWSRAHGETYCPLCSQGNGLEDPWGQAWRQPQVAGAPGNELEGANEPVPSGPAVDDPATKDALVGYLRRTSLLLFGAGAFLVVIVLLIGAETRSADRLLKTGVRTEGLIIAASNGHAKYMTVTYRVGASLRHGQISFGGAESYFPGEPVQVIYDPHDPARIRTPQDANDQGLTKRLLVYALLAGIGLVLAAANAITRPPRWRRILRAPWRPYVSSYIPGRRRRAAPGLRLVPVGGSDAQAVTLRLGLSTPQRSARLTGKRIVWACGDPTTRMVIGLPGTRELYSAHAVRGYLGRQWTAAQKPPSRRSIRALRVYLWLLSLLASVMALYAISIHSWLLAAALAIKVSVLVYLGARRRSSARAINPIGSLSSGSRDS